MNRIPHQQQQQSTQGYPQQQLQSPNEPQLPQQVGLNQLYPNPSHDAYRALDAYYNHKPVSGQQTIAQPYRQIAQPYRHPVTNRPQQQPTSPLQGSVHTSPGDRGRSPVQIASVPIQVYNQPALREQQQYGADGDQTNPGGAFTLMQLNGNDPNYPDGGRDDDDVSDGGDDESNQATDSKWNSDDNTVVLTIRVEWTGTAKELENNASAKGGRYTRRLFLNDVLLLQCLKREYKDSVQLGASHLKATIQGITVISSTNNTNGSVGIVFTEDDSTLDCANLTYVDSANQTAYMYLIPSNVSETKDSFQVYTAGKDIYSDVMTNFGGLNREELEKEIVNVNANQCLAKVDTALVRAAITTAKRIRDLGSKYDPKTGITYNDPGIKLDSKDNPILTTEDQVLVTQSFKKQFFEKWDDTIGSRAKVVDLSKLGLEAINCQVKDSRLGYHTHEPLRMGDSAWIKIGLTLRITAFIRKDK